MEKLDDIIVSRAIIEEFMNDFLDYTDIDVAIGGEGYFQVMDPNGEIFYTKAGMLDIDAEGNLALMTPEKDMPAGAEIC